MLHIVVSVLKVTDRTGISFYRNYAYVSETEEDAKNERDKRRIPVAKRPEPGTSSESSGDEYKPTPVL